MFCSNRGTDKLGKTVDAMILTVTMNPSIDKYMYTDRLAKGETNRVVNDGMNVAGKGINVARVIKSMMRDVFCTGINYDINGALLTESLQTAKIGEDFAIAEGLLRTNLKIRDGEGYMTEINENGFPVGENVVRDVMSKIIKYADQSEIVMLCGSLPPNVPVSFYGTMINELKIIKKETVLDADGKALFRGIKSGPAIIKPNLKEFEALCETKMSSIKDVVYNAKNIANSYEVKLVIVSLGSEGAIITDGCRAFYSRQPEKMNVVSTTGAGDALLAGATVAYTRKKSIEEILQTGMAAANIAVSKGIDEKFSYKQMRDVIDSIKVEMIDN